MTWSMISRRMTSSVIRVPLETLANAVGLVLDTDERGFQVLDELVLPGCQLAGFLLRLGSGSFFQHLERRGGVFRVVAAAVVDLGLKHLVVPAGLGKLLQDQFLELLELFVTVADFLYGFFFLLFHNAYVFKTKSQI